MIKVGNNPIGAKEYFIIYENEFTISPSAKISLKLTFVPDVSILDRESYNSYLENIFGKISAENIVLEKIAGEILEDLSNELVPFWINIRITHTEADKRYQIILEDRQPGWDNPPLLSSLKRIN